MCLGSFTAPVTGLVELVKRRGDDVWLSAPYPFGSMSFSVTESPAVADLGGDQFVVDLVDGGQGLAAQGARSAAAELERAWPGLLAPGMIALTPGWSMIQRSANWAIVAPSGTSGARRRTASRPVS